MYPSECIFYVAQFVSFLQVDQCDTPEVDLYENFNSTTATGSEAEENIGRFYALMQ